MNTRKHEIHWVQHTRKQEIQENKKYKKTISTRTHEILENKKFKNTSNTRKHEHTRKQEIQEIVARHHFTLYSTYVNLFQRSHFGATFSLNG